MAGEHARAVERVRASGCEAPVVRATVQHAAAHIDRMGGRVGILILALNTPPQTIHWFSLSELDQLGVVTIAARATVGPG